MKGIDYVFQAAGSVGSAGATPAGTMADLTLNLIIAERMLHAAWLENIERFLLLGSSTVYPALDHPVKEEEAWSGPTHPAYFGYGWMKRYLEKLAEYVASKSDVKIALVRPTATYGSWDYSGHVVPMLISKALEKLNPFEVWGTGNEIRDFLHAKDLARGCLLMLEKHAVCEPVNLGYGQSFTISEIVNLILKATNHSEAKVEFDPSRPTAIPFRMVDTTKAKDLLGFEPELSLEDGIIETVDWQCRATS
jgi:GDP-L-fucose synthase